MNMAPHIYIIAGEASGDRLGAKLMRALKKKTQGNVRFSGIGGHSMSAEGLQSLFPMQELSIIGMAEILPRLPKILGLMAKTIRDIHRQKPDLLLTIDSPAYNYHIAKYLGSTTFPKVHYVAPTVWAYRPGRARKWARLYNHMLLLLPFEAPYFEAVGLKASFVGHSIVEEHKFSPHDGTVFRAAHGLAEDQPLLLMMPGSRMSELKRLLPVYEQTVLLLLENLPSLEIAMPILPHHMEFVKEQTQRWRKKPILVPDAEKHTAMYAANAALVKSGTSSLEVALAKVPMVITYKVTALTAFMLRRMIKVPFVTLVNILESKEIIPEFLQEKCRPDLLAPALRLLLEDRIRAGKQVVEAQAALKKLGLGATSLPSENAADAVLNLIKK